jgi:glucosylglycerol 3-phosphatase
MTSFLHPLLNEPPLSLNVDTLTQVLVNIDNVLIIQDLDGVCMGLVQDPLSRVMRRDYVEAAALFSPHFYVLTNGEHGGKRGVNHIVEQAFGYDSYLKRQGRYLPGLAAGGVQWQDSYGQITHPGVSDRELTFLKTVPARIEARLRQFFTHHPEVLTAAQLQDCIEAAVLDNIASPTANLNRFYAALRDRPPLYAKLQDEMQALMHHLLEAAQQQGLENSFFIHYAPNLGRDAQGLEIMRPATEHDSGTTDFQFMVRGAVKEAGVPALLNHYYALRTGRHPLGETFNARQAPHNLEELIDLVATSFDPLHMPVIIGVGDTVNSQVQADGSINRGGSDRNFLQLIQGIGQRLHKGNIVAYVDSSQGEVKNRRQVIVEPVADGSDRPGTVLQGPCDPADENDPLTIDLVFAGGHRQYTAVFEHAAQLRHRRQVNARRYQGMAPDYWGWIDGANTPS